MADENMNIPEPQPDPATGDVLGAMKAAQADMASLYQLEQIQNQSLESLIALQEFANDQLKQQTALLENIYRLLSNQNVTAKADAASKKTPETNRFDTEAHGTAYFQDLSRYMAEQAKNQSALEQWMRGLEESAREAKSDEDLRAIYEEMHRTNAAIEFAQQAGSTWGSSQGAISAAGSVVGQAVGQEAGDWAGGAIAGALTPMLGPAAMVVGEVGGDIVGKAIEKSIGRAFEALSELYTFLEGQGRKTRDEVIEAGFTKIKNDLKDMSTYAVDIYQNASSQIYAAWDRNLGTVTATMGYTKEALNTLQDSVAQKLDELGYSQSINAADYLDQLSTVLGANLNDKLAEAFATQSLILQKAVPEVDMTSMAAEFAAIYTNAAKQGLDAETAMTDAMNQVAGAVKAIEQTTQGNNQFIQQVPAYLQQAQEIVARAGGSVDNVASLTTQMMAAEGPLAALAPQLSGFTGELVSILTKQNDATAVALRAIMHDINTDIGVSATDFMQSFMEDTQGTLVTAFEAIDQFIERNENPAARQEFLEAMEDLFGIQGDKLAQLDFGYIGEQLAQTNASLNTSALLDAEALVKDGETATLEEQLVANTANMLLSTNAVRDTLDNALMRKLEQNELNMERLVYEATSTQAVDLAQNTMSFFTHIKDIFLDLLDPFGLFKAASSVVDDMQEAAIDTAMYAATASMSSIGSDATDSAAGALNTFANTVGGATAVIAAAGNGNDVDTQEMRAAARDFGVAGSTLQMFAGQSAEAAKNQALAAQSFADAQEAQTVGNYQNQQEQERRQQERDAREQEQQRLREQAAAENQARAEEEAQRAQENHDNLSAVQQDVPTIRDSIDFSEEQRHLDAETDRAALNEYMQALIDNVNESSEDANQHLQTVQENSTDRVVTAIEDNKPDVSTLDTINEGVDRLITLFSTYLELLDQQMRSNGGEGLQMSYSDRAQIMGRGLIQ